MHLSDEVSKKLKIDTYSNLSDWISWKNVIVYFLNSF